MSPLGRGSPAKQNSREVLASGLQKPWSALRAKQLVPPHPSVGWQRVFSCRVDADKIGPNSSLPLTAMEPSQGISPLYPGHLSQAVAMKNLWGGRGGGCYDLVGKLHGVCQMSGACKEFSVYRWGQQRQLWQRQRQSPEFWPTYSMTPRGGTKLQDDNTCQLVGAG